MNLALCLVQPNYMFFPKEFNAGFIGLMPVFPPISFKVSTLAPNSCVCTKNFTSN